MSIDLNTAPRPAPSIRVRDFGGALPPRVLGAALCVAVAAIHVMDQGGLPGDKTPTYVGIGYYLLEVGAVAAAVMLVGRSSRRGWLLSLGVGLAPFVGYVLSRGPGLPVYGDDRGNWTEPIGLISLAVEATLLLLALVAVQARPTPDDLQRVAVVPA